MPVEEFDEEIEPRLAMGETMMLGLRLLREGVPRGRFAARHGRAVDDVFARGTAPAGGAQLAGVGRAPCPAYT